MSADGVFGDSCQYFPRFFHASPFLARTPIEVGSEILSFKTKEATNEKAKERTKESAEKSKKNIWEKTGRETVVKWLIGFHRIFNDSSG